MGRVFRISPAIFLAVLFATTLVSFSFVMQSGIKEELQRAVRFSVGDATVIVEADGPNSSLPTALAADIEALPGVSRVTEQVAGVAVADDELGTTVAVQSLHDATGLTLTAGKLPTAEGEAVIVEEPASSTRMAPGAGFGVQTDHGAVETITVVGTATAQLGAVDQPSLPTVLCSLPDAQRLLAQSGSSKLLVHTHDDGHGARTAIADLVHREGLSARTSNADDYIASHTARFATGARTITLVLQLMTAVALLAAFVVIGNNYQLLLARSTHQIALLRTIGALRRQIFAFTVANAAVVGLLGAVAGTVLGTLGGIIALKGPPDAISDPRFWIGLLACGVVGGVCPSVLAALRPAWLATQVAPCEALRRNGSVRTGDLRRMNSPRTICGLVLVGAGLALTIGGGLVASVVPVAAGVLLASTGLILASGPVFTGIAVALSGIAGHGSFRLAAKHAQQDQARSAASAIAVWLGTTLMTALLVGSATAQATLAEAVDGATPTDVIVTQEGDIVDSTAKLRQLPEVEASAIVSGVMLDAVFPHRDNPLTVIGYTPDLPHVLATKAEIPSPQPGTIILPPTPDTTEGVNGASPVTVMLRQDGRERHLSVQVVDGAPMVGIVNQVDLSAFTDVTDDLWVTLAPGIDPIDGMNAIAQQPGIVAVSSPAVARNKLNDTVQQYAIMAAAFLLVTLIIAVVGLSNTVAVSVAERTREIGVLRAIGALRRQVIRMILAETLLLAVSAGIIGIVFGLVFGVSGASAVLGGEHLRVVVDIPLLHLIILLTGLLTAAVLASVIPARRAASIPPVVAMTG